MAFSKEEIQAKLNELKNNFRIGPDRYSQLSKMASESLGYEGEEIPFSVTKTAVIKGRLHRELVPGGKGKKGSRNYATVLSVELDGVKEDVVIPGDIESLRELTAEDLQELGSLGQAIRTALETHGERRRAKFQKKASSRG